MEPDYANSDYLMLVGRTVSCAIGVQSTMAANRERGGRIVFVDPRMPEPGFAGSEWIPIKPGTDAAFLHSLILVGRREGLVDLNWIERWTNAAYLVRDDMMPIRIC